MARIPGKALPWALILQLVMAAREHWGALPPKERERLREIMKRTKGRPQALTAADRRELKHILGQADLPGLAQRVAVARGRTLGRKRFR
jgi:hypothetical protein